MSESMTPSSAPVSDATITDSSLRISRIIPASPEQVFEAWTNPEIMSKWCAPEGIDTIDCISDLKVGGRYEIKMTNPEGGLHTAVGTYREISRPDRLVYTWDWVEEEFKMNVATLITVEFNSMGDATEVVMTHDLFPNREMSEAHGQGWASCFNRLKGIF